MNERRIERAKNELELARANKDLKPGAYVQALIVLASMYRADKQEHKFLDCYREAVELYKLAAEKIHVERVDLQIWRCMMSMTMFADFEEYLLELMAIAEREQIYPSDKIDKQVAAALSNRKMHLLHGNGGKKAMSVSEANLSEKAVWKAIVELRTSTRGEADPSLLTAIEYYAKVCQQCNQMSEAEEAYLRAVVLMEGQSTKEHTAILLRFIQLLVENELYEKAEATVQGKLFALHGSIEEWLKKDIDASIHALITLARSYRKADIEGKANEYYRYAFEKYAELNSQLAGSQAEAVLWSYVYGDIPLHEFEEVFLELFEVCERNTGDPSKGLDRLLDHAMSHRRNRSRVQHHRNKVMSDAELKMSEKCIWKRIVDLRATVRGPMDPNLAIPLHRYARICEETGDFSAAEEALLRTDGLADSAKTGLQLGRLILLVDFYNRRKSFDKASAVWRKALDSTNGAIDEYTARTFLGLADNYEKAGRNSEAEEIVFAVLERAAERALPTLDSKLEELYKEFIRTGSIQSAETLIERRLTASKNRGDPAKHNWQIKLSDLCIATGREEESEKLYREALGSMALRGQSTDTLRAERAHLLERLGRKQAADEMRRSLPVQDSRSIEIQFGLLAFQEIVFGPDTTICPAVAGGEQHRFRPPLESHGWRDLPPEVEVTVCCFGKTKMEGKCVLDGKLFGEIEPADAVKKVKGLYGQIAAPVVRLTGSFPPAPKPPSNAIRVKPESHLRRPHRTQFEPGDYVVSESIEMLTRRNSAGLLRFFLEDDDSNEPVISFRQRHHGPGRPGGCHLFYGGTKTIQLKDTCAVVYAPNATVEFAPRESFCGAIVAARIIARGYNRIAIDTTLFGVQLYPW